MPSTFNACVFPSAGVAAEKVVHVPPPIDDTVFKPPAMEFRPSRSDEFVFLSVFRWQLRKGWDVLIRAFIEEFSPDENVALYLHVAPFRIEKPWQPRQQLGRLLETYSARATLPRIFLRQTPLTTPELISLYTKSDAFVLPTRGEGWGRPLMEAMACELPTIATNWSGHLDFMTNQNSLLIDYEMAPVPEEAAREWPSYAGHRWAEPSRKHLRLLMRQLVDDRLAGREMGKRGRDTISRTFTPAKLANKIRSAFVDLSIGN